MINVKKLNKDRITEIVNYIEEIKNALCPLVEVKEPECD